MVQGSGGRTEPPCPSAACAAVKIATFNINNVVKRLDNLLDWLKREQPDVVCLQETKTADAIFPAEALEKAGYGAIWRGERTWNGVAILARGMEPVQTRKALPGDPGDRQARYIEAAVNGVLVCCLYLPNGNPWPGPKFDYKLAWLERLIAHAAALIEAGVPAVLAGDFNVVPTPADIYSEKSWKKNALLSPQARAAYARLLAQGWHDALAVEPRPYTFWSYLRDGWPRDAGWRIDHLLLSPSLAPRLETSGVDQWVRGESGASDHAPAWVRLGDA